LNTQLLIKTDKVGIDTPQTFSMIFKKFSKTAHKLIFKKKSPTINSFFLFSLKYKWTSFIAFSLQLHDEIETSDGQDAKQEEEEEVE